MILKTDRIMIKNFEEKDYQDFRLMSPESLSDGQKVLEKQMFSSAVKDGRVFGIYLLPFVEVPIGRIIFRPANAKNTPKIFTDKIGYEVSIYVKQKSRRKGYAAEALKGIVKHKFENAPKIDGFFAYINPGNTSSIKCFEKAGFSVETREKFLTATNYRRDIVVKSLPRNLYKESQDFQEFNVEKVGKVEDINLNLYR